MIIRPTIPAFRDAPFAPLGLLYLATFSRSERKWIAQQPGLLRDLRLAEPACWSTILERYRTTQRPNRPAELLLPADAASGMRRQALHDLHQAVNGYAALVDGRRCELFRSVCRLAKYVTHDVLRGRELREAFHEAAASNGALARYGARWVDETISRALYAGREDRLPPVARQFRTTESDR